MICEYLKSKIAHGRITQSELHYEGSITLDADLLQEAGMLPGERVQILNVNNGNRFDTYTIAGKAGVGTICLNGPAARQGVVGDQIMILSYASMTPEEAKNFKPTIIHLNESNTIKHKN